ncbi:hypothetical protein FP2506_12819 [Fulvimarina pelagi HTCC2506]|uniref:DUF547 domain-containing protein n=2 Tax=Fulvimarina pelagi TaxID=217511 RepID=Q0G1D2_9HYPH|nr:DUF547 domain-containing protein [Fulvimarina pelagi]EAU41149.1 hypothetical protein FP2506_12819 [Fulvimarina pelagi HTCC2506]BAT30837.1 hypothetical protein [Fulvimarina pelagi]
MRFKSVSSEPSFRTVSAKSCRTLKSVLTVALAGMVFSSATVAQAFEAKPFDAAALNDRADKAVAEAFAGHADEQTIDIDWQPYAEFLSDYVEDDPDGLNRFQYGAVSDADHQALKDMITGWTMLDVEALTASQKFAFYTNLYNALTLDVVLDHYPVESIRDIKIEKEDQGLFASLAGAFDIGPWSADLVTIDGTALSLDEIEHSILRPMGDERVHYSVNCASIGCPDLKPTPWTAETLEADLDAAARAYVNSDRGLRQSTTGKLLASKIFDWYAGDFGGADAVIAYLQPYADGERADWLAASDAKIVGYRYDWDLNDAAPATSAPSN